MALSQAELEAKINALKGNGKASAPEATKALEETKVEASKSTSVADLEAQLAALKKPATEDPIAVLQRQLEEAKKAQAAAPATSTPAAPEEKTKTRKSSNLLGKKVIDTVTGVSGTATQRLEELEGATKYCVEGSESDGKTRAQWFTAGRLTAVD